jgi:segregation and condensation protein B
VAAEAASPTEVGGGAGAAAEVAPDVPVDADQGADVAVPADDDADLVAEPLDMIVPDATEPTTERAPVPETSEVDYLRAIEAVVLVAHDPVPADVLAQLIERPVVDVQRWCEQLAEQYRAENRGFELVRVAGGYRYQTHGDLAPYVERFLLHDQRARLSGAALETLAIVAYKQPISRAQIASIRGVDPDGVLRTLQSRGYIDAVGRDNGPGQAVLFGTTSEFLERLGLDSIHELPTIADYIPGADVVEALEAGLRISPE